MTDANGIARLAVTFTGAGDWYVRSMSNATEANAASEWSAPARFHVTTGRVGITPAVPAGLAATALDAARIRLTWSEVTTPSVQGFVISDNLRSVTLPAGSRSYTWAGLEPGTYKCFRAYAFGPTGKSAWTNWACATTPRPSVTATVIVPASSSVGVPGPDVLAGQRVTVQATGTWCMGGAGPTAECGGPAGIRVAHADEADVVLPAASIGALIGQIGAGPLFELGPESTFVATSTGAIRLLFNDRTCCYFDNSGSVTATIAIGP
jgi:hypothetical protein